MVRSVYSGLRKEGVSTVYQKHSFQQRARGLEVLEVMPAQ